MHPKNRPWKGEGGPEQLGFLMESEINAWSSWGVSPGGVPPILQLKCWSGCSWRCLPLLWASESSPNQEIIYFHKSLFIRRGAPVGNFRHIFHHFSFFTSPFFLKGAYFAFGLMRVPQKLLFFLSFIYLRVWKRFLCSLEEKRAAALPVVRVKV